MTNEIESLTIDTSARRTGSGVSPMWFAFAGLALLLALYAHWRFGQFDDRIDQLRTRVTELRTSQEQLGAQVAAMSERLELDGESLRAQIRGFREVPTQVGELGQSVAELRARTEAPQRAWIRAEALYLLELGSRRLRLEHDVPTAIAAMESADARLATVADPAVAEVRAQLARELEALRAIELPDLPAVIARLSTLESQAHTLQMLGVPVAEARRADRSAAPEAGAFDRALGRLARAWRDLFSYRRADPGTSRLVTAEEESLRRQHLGLLLFAARVSAMQRDSTSFQDALRAAGEWLDRYFDVRHGAASAAREELLALSLLDIDPEIPEVGSAAQLLQRVIRATPAPATP